MTLAAGTRVLVHYTDTLDNSTQFDLHYLQLLQLLLKPFHICFLRIFDSP